MPRIDSEKFYTSAIEMHGTSAKGVNWASKESQFLRFKTILELLPKDLNCKTLVDAGCGFGDFYLYMEKKKRLPKEYVGIDSLLDMHSIASDKTGKEIILADICRDEIPQADYYICSGAMNVLDKFEAYLFIRNCFEACRDGFIFNVLHAEDVSETYNYMTLKEIEGIANELGVNSFVYRDDYMENDITLGFFH